MSQLGRRDRELRKKPSIGQRAPCEQQLAWSSKDLPKQWGPSLEGASNGGRLRSSGRDANYFDLEECSTSRWTSEFLNKGTKKQSTLHNLGLVRERLTELARHWDLFSLSEANLQVTEQTAYASSLCFWFSHISVTAPQLPSLGTPFRLFSSSFPPSLQFYETFWNCLLKTTTHTSLC